MKKNKSFFDNFSSSYVWLENHDKMFDTTPAKAAKLYRKKWGCDPQPRLWNPIVIQWQEKGRGFGEYAFWQEKGRIYCDNECDSREAVKRILCRMVDRAIFTDGPNPQSDLGEP